MDYVARGMRASGLAVSLKSGMVASSHDFGKTLLSNPGQERCAHGAPRPYPRFGPGCLHWKEAAQTHCTSTTPQSGAQSGKSFLPAHAQGTRAAAVSQRGIPAIDVRGPAVWALSPTAVRTLRRQAARACSTLGPGRCLTSLLALEMGENDSAKKVVRDVLELWIDIWLHHTAA